MKALNVAIHFIEPIRVIEWHDRKNRNSDRYLRGYGFARWHNSNQSGRPYITGTLVRSAVIHAVEQILWVNKGVFKGSVCCPGLFEGSGAKVVRGDKAARLRRRPTLSWKTERKICKKTEPSPCLFCLLLGRCDKAEADEEKEICEDKSRYDVKFSNFDSPFQEDIPLRSIADPRIVNRVDQEDGKAEDFYQIWEIDHERCGLFTGRIYLSDRADTPEIKSLLTDATTLVDTVAGALCWIEVQEPVADTGAPQSVSHPSHSIGGNPPFDAWAGEIRALFETSGKTAHLRMFADVVRELRRHSPDKALPRGHVDRLGNRKDHFIWDTQLRKNSKRRLRDWLPEKFEESRKAGYTWRGFCEEMGQALYDQAKKAAPEHFSSQRPVGAGQAVQPSKTPATELTNVRGEPLFEHLITGRLVAETPFFFGCATDADTGDQTSLRLLTTADGRLRFPRSALRGILRRDLAIAFGGGCRAELGHASPCACPVCSMMRHITLKDSRASLNDPPQIRHRIRLNQHTGTVDQGALFDMEVAPRGVAFPFELRFRNRNGRLPKKLTTVLAWWSEGKAAFSGAAGIGRGRFTLTELRHKKWNLGEELPAYAQSFGGRQEENATEGEQLEVGSEPGAPDFPWEEISLQLSVVSPFLTGDPIAGMLDPGGADSVCFQSDYMDQNGEIKTEFMLKSESFRGMLRTAVSRRHPETAERDHEECDCILCRIFGNQRKAGKVRVEDFMVAGNPTTKTIDRVAIDRFTGGAKDQHKFDMAPLVGSVQRPLLFKGTIWVDTSLGDAGRNILENALDDIRCGFYPLGGFGNIGFGWVTAGEMGEKTPSPKSFPLMETSASPSLSQDHIYWPHYFLKLAENIVSRENQPQDHQYLDKQNRYTGRLSCVLKTKTPLIVPDASDSASEKNENHKCYPFFSLNGEVCIPGSEIKGMISSVFEALTNSCLRVFDEKKRLSWRMKADKSVIEQFFPGMVLQGKNGEFKIKEMDEIRYPFYDSCNYPTKAAQEKYFPSIPNLTLSDAALTAGEKRGVPSALTNKLKKLVGEEFQTGKSFISAIVKAAGKPQKENAKKFAPTILKCAEEEDHPIPYYSHPTATDSRLLSLVNENRQNVVLGGAAQYAVIGHRKNPKPEESFMFLATPAMNKKGLTGKQVVRGKENVTGYLKITGPNVIEKEKLPEKSSTGLPDAPENMGRILHNVTPLLRERTVRCGENQDRDCLRNRLVPEHACRQRNPLREDEFFVYSMTKRCERVFTEKSGRVLPVDPIALEKFKILVQAYKTNADQQKTPPPFQTILPENGDIKNELLYFREENGKAVELIPVRISRRVDDLLLGHKLRDDFRPCVREILNEEHATTIKDQGVKALFQHHPEGLCPACAMFGTSFYKGRVAFGFAFPKNGAGPKLANNGDYITLPLLERPRPTWSMPRYKINQTGQGGIPQQPGSKRPRTDSAASNEGQRRDNGQDTGDPVPGRKLYVHHQGWKKVIQTSQEGKEPQTENNRSVQAVAPGQEFSFEIRFENLRDWELGLLIYAINLEPGMAHKLGMAKPLGFGSVEIAVNEVVSEKSVDMDQVNEAAMARLKKKLWETESDGQLIEKLRDLIKLLSYQSNESIRVRYPALRKEDDPEKKPGYVELGGDDGALKPKGRQKNLQTIWRPWH